MRPVSEVGWSTSRWNEVPLVGSGAGGRHMYTVPPLNLNHACLRSHAQGAWSGLRKPVWVWVWVCLGRAILFWLREKGGGGSV